jgi:hypothetical protein
MIVAVVDGLRWERQWGACIQSNRNSTGIIPGKSENLRE